MNGNVLKRNSVIFFNTEEGPVDDAIDILEDKEVMNENISVV